MKIFFALLFMLAKTLSATTHDFIVAKMSEQCIPADSAFEGIIVEGDRKYFCSLVLKIDGLLVEDQVLVNGTKTPLVPTKKKLDLKIFNQLIGCDNKKIIVARIKKYLATAGINTANLSQGLFGYRPVYIIGATQTDQKAAQVWIDKETFLPVRQIGAGFVMTFDKPESVGNMTKKFPRTIVMSSSEINYNIALSKKR